MRSIRVLFFFLMAVGFANAQSPITTFILVRHAERADDGSKDPDISEAGKARALLLANLLSQTKVDAIYSTTFKRTTNTGKPTADQKQLTIQNYDPTSKTLVDEMLTKHKGQTILCIGHSNTVPATINQIIGKEEYKNFDDTDFGNLVIVNIAEKGNAKITWLRY